MNRTKRAMAIVMAGLMVFCFMPGAAFADTTDAAAPTFTDMPNDWSTAALNSAVSNGLLKGYDGVGGMEIKPTGTLTRAEMATVVNRAFGAAEKASLSGVSDVVSNAWYAEEMAKAAKMGTMKKDTQMRPNASITRQEAFTVLARAFKQTGGTAADLSQFTDGSSVASYAVDGMGALVKKGYVSGANGMINPTSNITRAEFAKIMDNMVKQYVNTSGEVSAVTAGNVMINAAGVTMTGKTVNGDLIIGDGVGNGEVTLDGVKVTGDTIIRGGGVNSIIIKGDSSLGNVIVAKVDGNVRVAVEGNAKVSVIVVADGSDDVKIEGKITTLRVESETPVTIQNAEIANVQVSANANVTVAKDAKVTTLNVESKATITVNGTVSKIVVSKDAANTKVEIAKDAKVTTLEANGNVTTSGEGKPSSVTGSGTVTNDKGETTNKDVTTGGGSSGGGGGNHPSTPDYSYIVMIGNKQANITPLIKNAKFETGSYTTFASLMITTVNEALTVQDITDAKFNEALEALTVQPISTSAINADIVDAYNAFTADKSKSKLEALAKTTAAVLDRPTSSKEKIKAGYKEIIKEITNSPVTVNYKGETVELTTVTMTVGGTTYTLFGNETAMSDNAKGIDAFIDALYGKTLADVIGTGSTITVSGTGNHTYEVVITRLP